MFDTADLMPRAMRHVMVRRAGLLMLVWLAQPATIENPRAYAQERGTAAQGLPRSHSAAAPDAGERQIRKPQPIFTEELTQAGHDAWTVPLEDYALAAPPKGETGDGETWDAPVDVRQWETPLDMHHWEAPCNQPGSCGRCPGVCRCPGHPAKPRRQMPGDVDRGDCPPVRYQIDQRLRSGDPDAVYKWAQPTYSPKYSAWYVGGGGGFIKGRSRAAHEGTWGMDYNGLFGHAKVWLNYTCNRYQGGEGAYQTEHEPLRSRFQHGH